MPKVKNCASKDIFERINYLNQVANLIAIKSKVCNDASSMYTNLLLAIGKKAVQRIDVNIKRTICKGCHSLLLNGVTCKVRIKKKKARWTCLKCDTVKIFDCSNPNFQLWNLSEESVVSKLDYSENKK